MRRISELEKNFKVLSSTINIDSINQKINIINEALNTKTNQPDFIELKDLYSKIYN